jgi:hypothetical protein
MNSKTLAKLCPRIRPQDMECSQRGFYIQEVQRAEDVENYVGGDIKHRSKQKVVQGVLLGHPIHTLSYTEPSQKRKLSYGQVCIVHPSSSYPVPVNSKSTLEFSTTR